MPIITSDSWNQGDAAKIITMTPYSAADPSMSKEASHQLLYWGSFIFAYANGTLEAVAKETQAFVYDKASSDDSELLGKLKAAGMQVNTPNKDAFIAASRPVYQEFSKDVKGAKEVIDRAIALGK